MTSNPSSPSLRPKPLDALVAAAVITQHGQTVRTVPLTSLDKELVIPLDDGNYHLTVHVDGTGVYVADSDCPGQDCVHTGRITRSGQSIVCLPEQVVIQLTGGTSDADVVLG